MTDKVPRCLTKIPAACWHHCFSIITGLKMMNAYCLMWRDAEEIKFLGYSFLTSEECALEFLNIYLQSTPEIRAKQHIFGTFAVPHHSEGGVLLTEISFEPKSRFGKKFKETLFKKGKPLENFALNLRQTCKDSLRRDIEEMISRGKQKIVTYEATPENSDSTRNARPAMPKPAPVRPIRQTPHLYIVPPAPQLLKNE